MADIALLTAGEVQVVETKWAEMIAGVAGEDITAGAPITWNTAGRWVNADANGTTSIAAIRAIATETRYSGQALTGMKRGILEGFVFDNQAYGAPIYGSNTVGRLADAAGGSSLPIGRVYPAFGNPPLTASVDKVLFVDISFQEDLLV